MSDINVSIYGSCNRPHLWKWFYDTVSMNNIKFEIIFVGNVEPTFKLPDNFHFVYSNVKPTQCMQAAALMCSGEVMQLLPDDCQNSPHALDLLYEKYKSLNNYKSIIAPKFIGVVEPPRDMADIQRIADNTLLDSPDVHLRYNDYLTPQVCVGGLMSRKFFNELGGYDKRFILGYTDLDMQIRAQMAGGKIVFYENAWVAERKDLCPGWLDGISKKYSPEGSKILDSLWFVDGKFSNQRTDEFTPFEENEALLIQSQGPRGEWN